VPAVYLVALWLHGGNEDILIPSGAAAGRTQEEQAVYRSGIIRALRATVVRTKEFRIPTTANQRKRPAEETLARGSPISHAGRRVRRAPAPDSMDALSDV
jgi:hypothetical protein